MMWKCILSVQQDWHKLWHYVVSVSRTVPACVPAGRSQSQFSFDMELTHTLQRVRHAHAQSTKPAMHTYRPLAKQSAPVNNPHNQPDPIFLHPCVSSRTCESTSPSSSTSSYSSSPVSKTGSPRMKRVVFADCVGLPLVEVRMFVGEPPADSPSHCPKRAPGPMGVPPGRCPLHQSVPASSQLGPDFPAFRAVRPQDRMPFQAHNDTLRRVNGNFQKALTHGLPKAHMPANVHILATSHGLPKAHTQPNAHMHATGQTTEHTQPKAHTQLLSHQLPKGPVHAHPPPHANNQVVSQRPPSCGHSLMVSRQQSTPWQRSRSPLPQPDSPPQVRSLASQNWAWQEGMAVHWSPADANGQSHSCFIFSS